MDSFIRRSEQFGYCAENTLGITKQFDEADDYLLKRILSNENHTLLPPRTDHGFNLHKCMHEHKLQEKKTML